MSPEIHVVVSHYLNETWFEIQKKNLAKFASQATIHAVFEKNPPEILPTNWLGYGYTSCTKEHGQLYNDHGHRLNYVTEKIIKDLHNRDCLFYMDSDVVLMRNIKDAVKHLNGNHEMVAPIFNHAKGIKWPFSAFCAITASFWKRLNGDWRNGRYRNYIDQGAFMAKAIRSRLDKWKILKVLVSRLHPFLFEQFEDFAFHCGAGSRWRPTTRVERSIRKKFGEKAFVNSIDRNRRIMSAVIDNLLAEKQWDSGLGNEKSYKEYRECLKRSSTTA
jgi:hypothetical protein